MGVCENGETYVRKDNAKINNDITVTWAIHGNYSHEYLIADAAGTPRTPEDSRRRQRQAHLRRAFLTQMEDRDREGRPHVCFNYEECVR